MCARAPSRLETTCWAGGGTASIPRRSGTRVPISPSNDQRVCACVCYWILDQVVQTSIFLTTARANSYWLGARQMAWMPFKMVTTDLTLFLVYPW